MNITVETPVLAMVRLDGIAYYTGEVAEVTATHLILVRATWHRSTGRHHEFIAGGASEERERYNPEQRVLLALTDLPLVVAPWAGNLDAPSV